MKRIIIIVLVIFTSSISFSQNDTIWFSKKWKKAIKEKASFYRPFPKKVGNLYKLKDYLISGELQMETFSKHPDKDVFEGKAIWYNKDGSISEEGEYKNNKLNGVCTSYKGAKKHKAIYLNNRVQNGVICYKYGNTYEENHYKNNKGDTEQTAEKPVGKR